MGVTVLFNKLFQFKDELAAILKRYCCHGNVTYEFIFRGGPLDILGGG